MPKKIYVYYQPNHKDIEDKASDCSIRAFTKALNKSWLEIFDELVPFAREVQCLFNQKRAYEPYLKSKGFTYHSVPRGTTLYDFCKSYKGTAVCYIRVGYGTHLVTCSGGQFFDTWNCGNKYMFGYYSQDD